VEKDCGPVWLFIPDFSITQNCSTAEFFDAIPVFP